MALPVEESTHSRFRVAPGDLGRRSAQVWSFELACSPCPGALKPHTPSHVPSRPWRIAALHLSDTKTLDTVNLGPKYFHTTE